MTGFVSPLSQLLRARLSPPGAARVTVGQLLDLSEQHAYGLLFAALALPAFIPVLPWGTAAAIGAVYVVLGLQRLLGLRRPWLPQRVRSLVISSRMASFLLERALPVLERLEQRSARRLPLATAEPVGRLAGLAVTLLGLLMLSPLPFLNSVPALLVLVIGLGFLKEDGLFLVAGSAAGAGLFGAVAVALAMGVQLARWPW
ncbi:MAG TPA: exopolysaccharide biosynthesis protein [Limnochordales bacterium]